MKNINLRQLEAFRAVMLTKSITRAAEMLSVSQPAVSRLISDLESSIEFPLFERVKKRLIPTPEAEALFDEVERSFAGLNKINIAVREIRDFRSGSLSVASLPALGLGYLPEIISQFAADRPGVSLSLIIRGSQNVSSMVAAQRVDVGFTESIDLGDSVDSELLLTTNLVCILPPGHRLNKKDVIKASDLDGETFIGTGNWQLTCKDIDRYFDHQKVRRKIQIDTQLHATVAELVLAGAGVSMIDPVTADRYISKGLVVKPFLPSILYNLYVLYPENRPRSRLAEQFVAQIRQDIMRYASKTISHS
ncbi:MAG: LysR family transcriptional regulator [Gammaproteobacteria bacterium]|nr:LysR family transcriptional regulator [Gammaproteobacteria bacterium]